MRRGAIATVGQLMVTPLAQAVDASGPGTAAGEAMQQPVSSGDLLQLTLGLLVVLAGVFAVAWLLRRTGRFQLGGNGALRIIGGMSLGARERVLLVEVGQTQLLLGVAPGRVQTLHVLDDTAKVSPNVVSGSNFAERMATALRRTE